MIGVPGVFKMLDTFGFPLEEVVFILRERGYVVAWDEFIRDARNHGWKDKTIRRKILSAVSEVFDKEYVREVERRLGAYVS
jgi:alanyl-tRNA synthetase